MRTKDVSKSSRNNFVSALAASGCTTTEIKLILQKDYVVNLSYTSILH